MEMNRKYSPDFWAPIQKEQKDSERIERPSLTFAQDAWDRLKRNRISMLALCIIVLIALTAIFVPMFWAYSYDQQDLTMSNMPFIMNVYPITENTSIYVTPGFSVAETTHDGHLLQLLEPVKKDIIGKKNIYEYKGKSLIIDYSRYSSASSQNKKMKSSVSLQRCNIIYDNQLLGNSYKIRNKTYLMDTDYLGRDLFIRIVYGARISLTVGIVAAIINFVVGVFYGGISGYIGGKTDIIMMRIVDTIDSIPMMLYVILIMVIVGAGITSIILALGLTFWVKMARIVRGQVLTLKQQEFVKAAIVIGADTGRILRKHLIPNIMGPIMVAISMQIPSAIFTEAFLSFVGLGVSAPQASWGTLANDALTGIYVYPYQLFFPALAISITILSFNLFSDGLRDALDPKLRK